MDRLSNMLSAIKNAVMAKKKFIEIPHTKECEEVANVLKESGFLSNVKVFKEKGESFKKLRLDIVYNDNNISQVTDLRRISTPGKRVYSSSAKLRPSRSGFGVFVVSTSRGIMNGMEARKKKLGGEVLCEVY